MVILYKFRLWNTIHSETVTGRRQQMAHKKLSVAIIIILTAIITLSNGVSAQVQTDSSEVEIKAIDITGNFEVSDDEILAVVTSKVGEILSTEKLEEDLQRIFDLGYFSKDVKASLAEYEGGARVTFRVEENPVVNDILVEGNSSVTDQDVLDMIKTTPNTILNNNTLRGDIETIEKQYHDTGFLAARVIDAKMDQDNNLIIMISEGIIQAINISYVTKNDDDPEQIDTLESGKTKPYVITREMKVKPGDTYNTNRISKDLQRIYNLGFFEDVHTRVEPGDQPGYIVLIIEVEETNTGSAGFGAGYSSNTGLTGFLTLQERNLKGKGRRADIKLEFGGKRDNYELGYFEPWLDRKQTSLELSVYNSSTQNLQYGLGGVNDDDYEEIRRGFNFTVGRPITDYTRVYIGFKTEDVNVEPVKYDYLDGTSRSMTGTIRTDTRDNVFNPTSGRYDSGSLEIDGGFLGGDFDYQKFILDIRRFRAIRKKQVFAFRIKVGLGNDEIPRFDYFDIGGVNTLRGYDEYQFSGTKMILYNAEYRFIMSGNLSAVLFADAGQTWMDVSDMDPSPMNMPKSIGAGLRLKIPVFGIGPVRLDYAYALSIEETKIHFGFGHMF